HVAQQERNGIGPDGLNGFDDAPDRLVCNIRIRRQLHAFVQPLTKPLALVNRLLRRPQPEDAERDGCDGQHQPNLPLPSHRRLRPAPVFARSMRTTSGLPVGWATVSSPPWNHLTLPARTGRWMCCARRCEDWQQGSECSTPRARCRYCWPSRLDLARATWRDCARAVPAAAVHRAAWAVWKQAWCRWSCAGS